MTRAAAYIIAFIFHVSFACIELSKDNIVVKYAFSNVGKTTRKLVEHSMMDVERFSGHFLLFKVDKANPCLFVSMTSDIHPLGTVDTTSELIQMNLNQNLFHSFTKNEKKKIILHELGHVIGLSHTNNTRDIMYYQINSGQQIDSYVQAVRKRTASMMTPSERRRKPPVQRTVNVTIIPTSFAECLFNTRHQQLEGDAVVSYSFSKTFDNVVYSKQIRDAIDVCHKFLEIISPLTFVNVGDVPSCINYSFDDMTDDDEHSISFPSTMQINTNVEFMIHVIRYFSKSDKNVVFNTNLGLKPNQQREKIQQHWDKKTTYSPIAYFFFTFFTKVIGFAPRHDGVHYFLDPENMFYNNTMLLNNCIADFSILTKAIDMYVSNVRQ